MNPSRAGDEVWMARALELARRGEGMTRPNPPVGAVVVREHRAVGEGYHRRAGTDHAEIAALHAAGRLARAATLYLTLEPCCTQGRTPPCTEAILRQGIGRVVIAARDPNPSHNGRGLSLLRRSGLEVTEGVLAERVAPLIAPFAKWVRTGRPFVTLKLAMSLDGRIADRGGCSKWISGPASRRCVQSLRRRADALLVGAGTARTDDPTLLPRPARGRRPWRVIVTTKGALPARLRVLSDQAACRTLVATTSLCTPPNAARLRLGGAEVKAFRTREGRVSLRALLRELGRRGLLHVVCEGGGRLAGELTRQGLVDAFCLFLAPRLLGDRGARAAWAGLAWTLAGAPLLRVERVRQMGDDLCIDATPNNRRRGHVFRHC
jgi:diaminohydroxyphosphoribosylaminopyrimidine deaminase/5-amino-6-(5-phosphoribosylamino)uracil reductase